MPAATAVRRRRLVLAALVAVPVLTGVVLAGAELRSQGLEHWLTAARHARVQACADSTASPSVQCSGRGRG